MTKRSDIAVVAIGRNEGARLKRCLRSVAGEAASVVYVDSGSTDGSTDVAQRLGAHVVTLDMSLPFTAARARNTGFAEVRRQAPDGAYVQFIDGDCELDPDWIAVAAAALDERPDLAVVCGRRREKFPEASLYNRIIDAEWNSPVGEARACGGDSMMRRSAFDAVGGFRDDLIAGEEPELCFRLRDAGWRIWRLDAEMTLHDAAMTRFGQWWQRSRRAGHTYAEGAMLHGAGPERYRVREATRTLAWGVGLPVLAVLGAIFVSPYALLLFAAYPLQWLRLLARGLPGTQALLLVLGKIPEAQGALEYFLRPRKHLIEYK